MNKKLLITLWVFSSSVLLFWCAWKNLTRDQLKDIMATQVGVNVDDIRFFEMEKDLDDGMYDVEFVANGIEYSYEVNPVNGNVIRPINTDANVSADTGTNHVNNIKSTTNYLTRDEIKTIVANYAWVKVGEMKFFEAEMDYEEQKYDVEFYVNGIEYDYEIDSISGEIRRDHSRANWQNNTRLPASNTNTEQNIITNKNLGTNSQWTIPTTNYLTRDEIKTIVANYAWVKVGEMKFFEAEMDCEEQKYDVEFYANGIEYDYEINAINGNLIRD